MDVFDIFFFVIILLVSEVVSRGALDPDPVLILPGPGWFCGSRTS